MRIWLLKESYKFVGIYNPRKFVTSALLLWYADPTNNLPRTTLSIYENIHTMRALKMELYN